MKRLFLAIPFCFLAALLAPCFLAAAVVPDSRQLEIAPPVQPEGYGYAAFGHVAATATSLGAQGFVVGWETAADTSYGGPDFTWGRRLLPDGSFADSLNPTTWLDLEDGWSGDLSFASLGQGRFVSVACVSAYDEERVYFRRFVAGHASPDPESVYLSSGVCDPHVASNGNGLFVIAFNDGFAFYGSGIPSPDPQGLAQVFDAGGHPVSPVVAVTEPFLPPFDYYPLSQPRVGMDASGKFTVVWTEQGTPFNAIWGRRFDRTGKPLGDRFRIGSQSGESPSPVAMVMAPSGEFVVAWGAPAKPGVMMVSHFTADGQRTGPLVRLAWSGTVPAMALDHAGRVALFWIDDSRRPTLAVFDASLARLGLAFASPVSSHTFDLGTHGGVAFGDDGRILTVWVGRHGVHRTRDSILGRFWKVR